MGARFTPSENCACSTTSLSFQCPYPKQAALKTCLVPESRYWLRVKQKSPGKKTKYKPCNFSAHTALSLYAHVKSVSLFPNSKELHLVWPWFRSPSSSGHVHYVLHCCSLGSYCVFPKKIMAISQGWVISDSWVREDFLVVHNFEV